MKHAIEIEKKYKAELPELSLSEAIGRESPYKPRGPVLWAAKLLVSHPNFKNSSMLHSDGKIELFYKSVMVVLLIVTLVLAALGGVTFSFWSGTDLKDTYNYLTCWSSPDVDCLVH